MIFKRFWRKNKFTPGKLYFPDRRKKSIFLFFALTSRQLSKNIKDSMLLNFHEKDYYFLVLAPEIEHFSQPYIKVLVGAFKSEFVAVGFIKKKDLLNSLSMENYRYKILKESSLPE